MKMTCFDINWIIIFVCRIHWIHRVTNLISFGSEWCELNHWKTKWIEGSPLTAVGTMKVEKHSRQNCERFKFRCCVCCREWTVGWNYIKLELDSARTVRWCSTLMQITCAPSQHKLIYHFRTNIFIQNSLACFWSVYFFFSAEELTYSTCCTASLRHPPSAAQTICLCTLFKLFSVFVVFRQFVAFAIPSTATLHPDGILSCVHFPPNGCGCIHYTHAQIT